MRFCILGATKFEQMISVKVGPLCAMHSGGTDAVEISNGRTPKWLRLTYTNSFADAHSVSDDVRVSAGENVAIVVLHLSLCWI